MRFRRKALIAYLFWAATGLVLLCWAAFFVFGAGLTDSAWAKLLPGFSETETAFGPSPAGHIRIVVGLILLLLTMLLAVAALVERFKEKLQQRETQSRLIAAAVAVACWCALFNQLAGRGWEAKWYQIADMMTHPERIPVFGQRLLMIWPAMLLKHFVPQLTYIQSFIVIQGLGLALAVYVVGEWAALFLGRELKFIGQIFLVALLLPTIDFYLGHDVGVVFSYSFCFLFLYKRQYWWFLLAFSLGVLNHQNILLMIPTAVVVLWPIEKPQKVVSVGAAAGIAYFSIQYILNRTVPVPFTHEQKLWFNMRQIVELHRTMIFGVMLTIPWWAGAALAFQNADPFLKRASVLFPMQLFVYTIYGQLNEARLFDGFLPVLIGIYLCYVRDRFRPGTAA